MSFWQIPIVAAKIAVSAPAQATVASAPGACVYRKDIRQTM
jgi:hypothetical protein